MVPGEVVLMRIYVHTAWVLGKISITKILIMVQIIKFQPVKEHHTHSNWKMDTKLK